MTRRHMGPSQMDRAASRRRVQPRRALILALALALAAGLPARAGTPSDPEIVDQAGDANGTGQVLPVSIAALDIRRVWFSAPYETFKELRPDGSVKAVRYVPTALVVAIETQGPKNAPDPVGESLTNRFHLAAEVPGCPTARFSLNAGPSSRGGGITLCSGYHSASVKTSGAVDSLTFEVEGNPWLVRGLRFGWNPAGTVSLAISSYLTPSLPAWPTDSTSAIDEAIGNRGYEFGSDLPPDVDCAVYPTHVDCT